VTQSSKTTLTAGPPESKPLDPVLLEVIRNALASVTDEMAMTIFRTARSAIVKDLLDFSVALCDRHGRMVGQGLSLPLQLCAIPKALSYLRRHFGDSLVEGDLVVMNDPYEGGLHLPDVFVFRPIFVDGALFAYAVTVAHQTDIGGRVAGSNATDSTEIYQEGLRIPFLKLYEAGRPNETFFRLIEKNVRLPIKVIGDLHAQAAACSIGARHLDRLVKEYGNDRLEAYLEGLLDYSERVARAQIAGWPDGAYEFEDFIDDDGTNDSPVRIAVHMVISGDQIRVDFAGSAPQVKAAINCPIAVTESVVYSAVRSVMNADIPNNEGFFRPITVTAPERSIVNLAYPAACAGRGLTAYRVMDVMLGVLAQAVPDRVPAAAEGGIQLITIGGYDQDNRPFIVVDVACGTGGARPTKDGIDGIGNLVANMANTPIELEERESPVLVREYGYVPDSGGAGRFRGGLALVRSLELREPSALANLRSDRRRFAPWGLAGGGEGGRSSNLLTRDGLTTVLPTKCAVELKRGDIVSLITPGGGGYGDAFSRAPEAVAKDVVDGKVSVQHARRAYGVVLDAAGLVDREATADLRAKSGLEPCGLGHPPAV